MGTECIASGENSLAIGFRARSLYLNCAAFGYDVSANSPGDGAVVFGKESQTSGQYSFAGGYQCEASGKFSVLDSLLRTLCQKGHRVVLFSQFTMVRKQCL